MLYSLPLPLKPGAVVRPSNSPHVFIVIETEGGDGCLLRRALRKDKVQPYRIQDIREAVVPADL